MGWFQHIFQALPSADEDAKPEHDLDYLVGETLASRSALAAIKRDLQKRTGRAVHVQEEFRGPVTLVHIDAGGRRTTFEIRRRR